VKAAPALPPDVEALLSRKLGRLQRDQTSAVWRQRTDIVADLRTSIRNSLASRAIGQWCIGLPVRAYEQISALAIQSTKRWPEEIWEAMEQVLERVQVGPVSRSSIDELVQRFTWAAEAAPPTLALIDRQRFSANLASIKATFGLNCSDYAESLATKLNLFEAAAQAGIANAGRAARNKMGIEIDEFLLAAAARARVLPADGAEGATGGKESPEMRRERLQARLREEKARGTRGFLKVVAAEEGISDSRLKQIVYPRPAASPNSWAGLASTSPKKKTTSK
jgi:hypothetical protein